MQTRKVGRDAKEDLLVEIAEAKDSENGEFHIDSKVSTLYGAHLQQLVSSAVETLELTSYSITIHDQGALDWVIQARLEAAAKLFKPDLEQELLPPRHVSPETQITKNRMRRSRLYLPGNQPDLMINAGLFEPDGVILDLEDSVAPAQKHAARFLVRNALRAVGFGWSELMVRINQIPMGFDDLPFVIPHGVHTILIPKAEQASDVLGVIDRIKQLSDKEVFLMPILESALGVENAYAIASAHPSVVALAFGAEDFAKDIGTQRTEEGTESFVARSKLIIAARAAGVQPIDTVYSDVANEAGLLASTKEAITLGFDGKGCIHPRQIRVIHEAFKPSEKDVAYACLVKQAMADAEARGDGAVSIGSKMVDPPVVARALKTLELARFYGLDPTQIAAQVNR